MFLGLLFAALLRAPAPSLRPLDATTPSGVHSGLRTDHALHALAGYASAAGGYAAAVAMDAGSGERLAAGLAREAFDAGVQDERASGADLVATALGGAVFVLLAAVAGS